MGSYCNGEWLLLLLFPQMWLLLISARSLCACPAMPAQAFQVLTATI